MDIQAIIRSRDDLARIVGLREKELQNLYLTAAALLDDIESIQAKLARVEWQPIETAPKFGKGFLACNSTDYDCIEWLIDNGHDAYFLNVNSENQTVREHWTHWMPLPEPPQALEQDD